MDCTKGGKANCEWNVMGGQDDNGEGVVTKSDACAFAVCGRLGDNRTMPPMIVFNFGDSLDPTWWKLHASSKIMDVAQDCKSLPWQQYMCNQKGITTNENTLVYVRIILHHAMGYPKPRDTHHGQQAVVICN
jgi:hypothetical protein